MPIKVVLLIGDSISIGYTPHVARALRGVARVVHHEGNCGDSFNVLANVGFWLRAHPPALVHFNVGLHDLRVWAHTRRHQVARATYAQNVARLIKQLQLAGARLIWATITPVRDRAPAMSRDFWRRDADVRAYNAAALRAVKRAGVPVDDLGALVRRRGPGKLLTPDGVHFTPAGYAALGAAAARAIRRELGRT